MDNHDLKDIFELIIINMKICGIDKSALGLRFYIWFGLLVLMMVEEISFFVSRISSENFTELIALVAFLGIGILSLAKIACIAVKRHKIIRLIEDLGFLYEEILHDPKYKDLTIQKSMRLKSLTKYYFVLNMFLVSVFSLSTPFAILYVYMSKGEVHFILPFSVIVPFSTDVWHNWLVVYIHSIMCGKANYLYALFTDGYICVFYYTTTDTLYCNLTFQVCNHFTIISKDIEDLTPANTDTLNRIVKRHQYILELSKILEDIFTAANLFNILVGSIQICAVGFSVMIGERSKTPAYILFLLSELLQILIMSVFGENIIRESQRVGKSAFLCEWYNMEQKYKKVILIIMIRAQVPQKLTAFNFSVICYETFTAIISTSWSYFTILKTMYKPSEVAHIE